jgi:hypothetical protein
VVFRHPETAVAKLLRMAGEISRTVKRRAPV